MDKTSSREELPGLVCALSRCYRAETGRIGDPASKVGDEHNMANFIQHLEQDQSNPV